MSNLKEKSASSGRWAGFKPSHGTLRELKASAAEIKNQVRKESRIFSNYSLVDGGKKLKRG
ncbi:MAG: hypothetical protein NTAFB09_20060 [Nitrosospira sp.]